MSRVWVCQNSRLVEGFHPLFHESVVGPLFVGVRGGTIWLKHAPGTKDQRPKMQPYYGSHGGLEKLFKNDAQGIRGTRFGHQTIWSHAYKFSFSWQCFTSLESYGCHLAIVQFMILRLPRLPGLWDSRDSRRGSDTPDTLGEHDVTHWQTKLSTVGLCCGYLCRHRSKGCSKAVHYVAIQYPHNQRFQKFAKVKG